MEIDRTLKIKEKYFNAILRFEKPFELRHFYLAPNSIVRLDCIDSNNIDTGRYIIFKSGMCKLINKKDTGTLTLTLSKMWDGYYTGETYEYVMFHDFAGYIQIDESDTGVRKWMKWFDKFCWDYINKAPTYLIEIAEILEVK